MTSRGYRRRVTEQLEPTDVPAPARVPRTRLLLGIAALVLVLDLVTKTLIDPGDVVVAEAPTYPGAVPVFSSYQADVVQIDVDGRDSNKY